MTRVHIHIFPKLDPPKDIPFTNAQHERAEDEQNYSKFAKRRDIENLLHARELAKHLKEPWDEDS